jgi:hypothetical protein
MDVFKLLQVNGFQKKNQYAALGNSQRRVVN